MEQMKDEQQQMSNGYQEVHAAISPFSVFGKSLLISKEFTNICCHEAHHVYNILYTTQKQQ